MGVGEYLRAVRALFYNYYPLFYQNKQANSMEWLSVVGKRFLIKLDISLLRLTANRQLSKL